MKIISAAPEFVAKVQVRAPLVMGDDEMRFPPATRVIPPGIVVDLKDSEAATILAFFGKTGVVPLKDRSPEDALLEAKETRMRFCYDQLRTYRQQQEERRAAGVGVSLPTEHLRMCLREYKALRKELGEDEVLTGDLPGLSPARGVDPIQSETDAFGLTEDLTRRDAEDALTRLQNDPGF